MKQKAEEEDRIREENRRIKEWEEKFDQDQKVKEDALIKKFYSDQSTTQTTETNNENLDENVNDENKNS